MADVILTLDESGWLDQAVKTTSSPEFADIILKGPIKDVRAYTDFSTAISTIGATECTLLIPDEQAVTTDETVPATMTLNFLQGGTLNISSTKTVTINGHVEAGLYQIFEGAGSVSFGASAAEFYYAEWFGALGNGTQNDKSYIEKMTDSVPDEATIKFISGKTYLIGTADGDSHVEISNKNLTIFAYGATFKMDTETGYSIFHIHGTAYNNRKNYLYWYGGTFDGNKTYQDYPGTAWGGGDESWDQEVSNCGLLGIWYYDYVLVRGIKIKNNVSDGVVISECLNSRIESSEAVEGADPTGAYPQNFKYRASSLTYAKTYFTNLYSKGGNIGCGYSASSALDGGTWFLDNISVIDSGQGAIWVETVKHLHMNNIETWSSNATNYNISIKIANDNIEAFLDNIKVDGGYIDGGNFGGDRIKKVINNVTVLNNPSDSRAAINEFDFVTNGYVKNSSYWGIYAHKITNCEVNGFAGYGVYGFYLNNVNISNDYTGTGIGQPEYISNTAVSKVLNAIYRSQDDSELQISNSKFYDLNGNIIRMLNTPAFLQMTNCYCADFGKNDGLDADDRAGIRATCKRLTLENCIFERTNNTEDWCPYSYYGNSAQKYLIWKGNEEIDIQHAPVFSSPDYGTVEIKRTLGDDESFELPEDSSGWGQVTAGNNDEYGFFIVNIDATVTLLTDHSTNFVNTDTDAKMCVFDNGDAATVKNRLGATKVVRCRYWF